MDDFAELPMQLQQQQISTNQLDEEGYSTVNKCLSPDYDTPTTNPQTSPQVHTGIYTSLANTEDESHKYTDLIRCEEPISTLTSNSEQHPQVHGTVTTQNDNRVTSHQSHHYTSLKDTEAIHHVYEEPTTSTNVSVK